MGNKTIIITGATSGIGRLAAFLLAEKNHSLVLVGRNEKKLKETIEELKSKFNNARIKSITGDLSVKKDLNRIVKDINSRVKQVDVLLNNAGVYTTRREVTVDGFEKQFMVNFLAPRFLSLKLLPLLKKAESARIVNISSRMHVQGKISFENLQLEKKYSGNRAYANSKLALILHTFHLASQLKTSTVSTIVAHPGVFSTEITRDLPAVINIFWKLFIPGPAKGAGVLDFLTTEPDLGNGEYYFRKKKARAKKIAYNSDLQNELESTVIKLF